MFVELAPIAKSTMIQLLITSEGDKMRVMVMPKAVEGQNPALSAPLSLLATPEEFDAKLPDILSNYAECRQSLEDSLENVKLVMDAAKKDAQSKATAKPAPVKPAQTKPASTAVKVDFHGDEDDDDLSNDEPYELPAAAKSFSAPKAQDSVELNLFG